MALCLASDVNAFLDGSKINATDGTPINQQDINDSAQQASADRIIRSYLAAKVDSATVAVWDGNSAPVMVKEIAARMVAAELYRKVYAQDKSSPNPYAQQLWAEAMALLNDVMVGNASLYDLPSTAIIDTEHINESNFQPNNAYPSGKTFKPIANPDATQNDYAFGMRMVF